MIENYYEILGVGKNATEEQIKKAYRINAIKYHPDKNFGDPEFAEKFIEIKNAYDVLINFQKRKEYDLKYQQFYSMRETETSYGATQDKYTQQYRTKTEKCQEEKFRYDSHKQFYSIYDRELQDTPQFHPIFDFWGDKLPANSDFFKLPQKIGKIIVGHSDLPNEEQPLTSKKKIINCIIAVAIGSAIGSAIFFMANLTSPFWICIWFIVPPSIALWLTVSTNKFKHTNLYVGVNGFALFTCENNRKNITEEIEVNFNDMTDFYVYTVEHTINFMYQETRFLYECFNRNTGELLFARNGEFNKRHNVRTQGEILNFCRTIERYWTVYLLDRLEQDIQSKGHVTFTLYSHDKNIFQEYIKLGIGFITFIKPDRQEFTYQFSDIKKMYIQDNELHIRHKNFERTLFFFKSGNEDVVPLLNLCNRHFFYKAMEILLGYSL